MSSLISLGSFNTSGGKTSGLGFASGLDSNALIDGILASRTASVKTIQDKITLNGKKTTAVGELSNLLSTLQTTADFLRGQTGVGKQDSDFFKHTTSSVSSSNGNTSYLSVTSQAGATLNSYKIENVVIANAQALRKDGFTSDSTSVVGASSTFHAGTFTLRGSSITISDGDTLKNIKAKINSVSQTSGVVADIVKIADGDYSLVLKAVNTGLTNKITEFSAGTIQIGADSVAFTEQKEANNASFDLDGVTITRATNTVSDAISGMTFSLLANTGVGGPTLNVDVKQDNSIIKSGVTNFITAYNNLKQFVSQQSKTDAAGNFVDTAILGGSSVLRDAIIAVNSQFSAIITGLTEGDPKTLSDVGVNTTTYPGDDTTPKTEGILTLDEAKFDAALATDFDAFRKVFASSFTANSVDVGLYKSSGKATLTSYKLDIDTSRADGDKVRVLDAVTDALLFNADYSNGLITGKVGTTLDGEQIIYSGDGTGVITVNSTKGIADRAYNSVGGMLSSTGLIASTLQGYTDDDKSLQKNVDAENAAIASERKLLVAKFTKLEAIVSQANSTLSFLEAQKNAYNSNN